MDTSLGSSLTFHPHTVLLSLPAIATVLVVATLIFVRAEYRRAPSVATALFMVISAGATWGIYLAGLESMTDTAFAAVVILGMLIGIGSYVKGVRLLRQSDTEVPALK